MASAETSSSWYVYILRCADDSLYTGVTTDLDKRLDQHNGLIGQGAKYTRARRPVALVYHEISDNRAEACRREAAIKRLKKVHKEQLITDSAYR